MNDNQLDLLGHIGNTEETTFNELCRALADDCPTNKSEWRELFEMIREMEGDGYLPVFRTRNVIDGIILTEAGAGLIRDRNDAKRGLLQMMK